MKSKKTNKKVLIIEDDKDFLSILKIKFTGEGFSIVTAEDGEEGLTVAEKEKPDLIISDVLMPRMDGLEMAKKIKESNSNIQILFLTNVKDADYLDNMKKLGVSEYLIKSGISINEILEKAKAKLGL